MGENLLFIVGEKKNVSYLEQTSTKLAQIGKI